MLGSRDSVSLIHSLCRTAGLSAHILVSSDAPAPFHYFVSSIFYYLIISFIMGGGVLTIGQSTLGIYLIQGIILEKLLAPLLCFDNVSFVIYNFLITPLIAVSVLAICMGLITLIRKNAWTSGLLLGQSPHKSCAAPMKSIENPTP